MPGWYPDPYYPSSTRYWDGIAWTGYAQGAAHAEPGPVLDLDTGRRAADRASKAFVAQAAIQWLFALLYPAIFSSFVHDILDQIDEPDAVNPGLRGGPIALNLIVQPLGLIGLVALVLILVWCHRATTNARALGRTTTHSPAWAVAGWLVPIVGFWYPYEVVRDLLPDDSPLRGSVKVWWGIYLASTVALLPLGGLALATSVPWALGASVLVLPFYVWEASAIRRIVLAIADGQEAAAAAARWSG